MPTESFNDGAGNILQSVGFILTSGCSVIEQGTHEELEKGGFYADLYASQFSGRNRQEAV
jgi:hypothetical protein